ncbi:MAG TPA: HAD family hydrolase, partial [Thermodesulfobacteriota bacterium]|nr:HAD family hydrolase [Thermodesulfobacteriota bacterium]
ELINVPSRSKITPLISGPVYETMGLTPLSYDDVVKSVGLGLRYTFKDLLGEENVPRALTLFRERYAQVFRGHTRLLPEAREVLEELHRRGVRLGVATNKLGFFSRAIFETFGLQTLVAANLGDGDVAENKPDPQMIEEAMRRMGVEKDNTVFVGDSLTDIKTGRNAGVRVFAVPTGTTSRAVLQAAGPTVVLDRLSDILHYVS